MVRNPGFKCFGFALSLGFGMGVIIEDRVVL